MYDIHVDRLSSGLSIYLYIDSCNTGQELSAEYVDKSN